MELLLGLDGDLAGLGGFVLGQFQMENAVLQVGIHLFRIHRKGQGKHAYEGAEAALLAVANALFGNERCALPLESELIAAGNINLQGIAIQARQFGFQVDRIPLLPKIDGRKCGPPGRCRRPSDRTRGSSPLAIVGAGSTPD